MSSINSDIDIDVGKRDDLLKFIKHIPASMIKQGQLVPHNTGIYVTDVPIDPVTNVSSIPYKAAEARGYFKIDILPVYVYEQVRDEAHLTTLMNTTPPWERLSDRNFVSQLIHIHDHYNTIVRMPEPINSITRMSMFLAVIRPGKKHLIGQTWSKVAETVWEKNNDDEYAFKKSHSVSYAHLVVVHMNLLVEQGQ